MQVYYLAHNALALLNLLMGVFCFSVKGLMATRYALLLHHLYLHDASCLWWPRALEKSSAYIFSKQPAVTLGMNRASDAVGGKDQTSSGRHSPVGQGENLLGSSELLQQDGAAELCLWGCNSCKSSAGSVRSTGEAAHEEELDETLA